MKIIRSTKCSLKFANQSKISKVKYILEEYKNVVNFFINIFWENCPEKKDLLKGIVNLSDSWFSARLKKVAAREAIDMINSAIEKASKLNEIPVKPTHYGKRMHLSSTICSFKTASKAKEFDCWLYFSSIGNKIRFNLPIRLHKHFRYLESLGKRCESYIVTPNYVQFSFKIETGPKRKSGPLIAIDSGINCLASLSNRTQYGQDIKSIINKINRKKHGSKSQKRARRQLRQRMDEVAKQIGELEPSLIVVERLKNISKNTKKKKISKYLRKVLSNWNFGYWLDRIQRECEIRRSSFRSVNPAFSSQNCPVCDHTEKRNRSGKHFICQRCGHTDNADINAAINLLGRYLSGPYGVGFKP